MRRIISKEDEEKKKRRNQFLVGGVLIFVMVTSIIGYSFTREQNSTSGNSQQLIYKGYTFTQVSGFWNVAVGNSQFSFKYNPNEVQKINSIINPVANYQGKPLYIDSENSMAATEIYKNLFYQNQIVQRVQDACLEGENCTNNAPIKSCQENIIIIKQSTEAGIRQQGNCVFIQGNSGNLTSLTDSFLYKIIGLQ